MSRDTVTCALHRRSRVSDDKGGKIETWAQVSGQGAVTGRLRYYPAESTVEQLQGGSAPGLAVRRRALFVFDVPGPGVLANDRIITGGLTYEVMDVRTYERTIQADAERVA